MVNTNNSKTECSQGEEDLNGSEERYRPFYEKTPAMLHSIDADGRILHVSDHWLEVLGYARNEVIGRRSTSLLTEQSREYAESVALPEFFQKGSARNIEYQFVRKDGQIIDVLLSGVQQLDQDGNFLRSLAVLTDVTEHKQVEDQFRQSQKLEAIGLLAGGIAHDFNNLLTGIIGSADLLAEACDPEDPVQELIVQIKSSADQAAALTSQLLAFGRRQLLTPKTVKLNSVVADVEAFLARTIGEDIELVLKLDPDAGNVHVDPVQLQQVLINVAINARDAMPYGGRLTFETGNPQEEPASLVMVAITDTGIGMDEDMRAHALEPFFTSKEVGKGTGLGLSMAYSFVKQSNGKMELRSEPGEGTSVQIYLPRGGQVVEVPDAVELPARGTEGNETVLLVEDDKAVRTFCKQALTKKGYRVIATGNSEEALRVCREDECPIALLLTDIRLPGLSGFEIASRVLVMRPGTRVLYMSGYSEDQPASGLGFLNKPFGVNQLVREIRNVLDSR